MDTNVCFEGQSGIYKKNGKAKKTELEIAAAGWLTIILALFQHPRKLVDRNQKHWICPALWETCFELEKSCGSYPHSSLLQGSDDQSGQSMHCTAYKTVTVVAAHTTKAPFQIKEIKALHTCSHCKTEIQENWSKSWSTLNSSTSRQALIHWWERVEHQHHRTFFQSKPRKQSRFLFSPPKN